MISRMRIHSSPQTVACALNVMVVTIATYSSPNNSVPELNELLKSGAEIDPLKEFAEAACEELRRHPSRPQGLRLPYRPPRASRFSSVLKCKPPGSFETGRAFST